MWSYLQNLLSLAIYFNLQQVLQNEFSCMVYAVHHRKVASRMLNFSNGSDRFHSKLNFALLPSWQIFSSQNCWGDQCEWKTQLYQSHYDVTISPSSVSMKHDRLFAAADDAIHCFKYSRVHQLVHDKSRFRIYRLFLFQTIQYTSIANISKA